MEQFQIISRPRHLRYLFFVNEDIPYDELFNLICSNLKIWGGRYNPIIPLNNNIIPERYLDLIKNYDPDFIFHTKEIDAEIIKSLRIFNPIGYSSLDEKPRREDITGVDRLYLLSQFDSNIKVLLTRDLLKTDSILLDYYKLNFGLETASLHSDFQITKEYKQLIIDPSNFNSLHKIIYEERPIIQSQLCARNVNTKLLRARTFANYNDFELVIAKDKTSNSDLLYYWNRFLFECTNVFYITMDELNILKDDKYFGGILYDLSINNIINVVSWSLTKNEVNEIIETKIKPIVLHREIRYKNLTDFPFEILDANGIYERDYGESQIYQTLISSAGLFNLPKLSFTKKVGYHAQRWAIDVTIKKIGKNFQNEIRFPLTTDTNYIFKRLPGRIKLNRNISIVIHNQQQSEDHLEIEIPDLGLRINQLVCSPIINGECIKSNFIDTGYNDASNKLLVFIKSFDYDLHTIGEFFTDIFWVRLFEYLCTNEKPTGDSIEFEEIIYRVINALEAANIKLGSREETYLNIENLKYSIKRTLEELSSYNVFFKGFKLKCPTCSSEFWYHINETNDKIICKGCQAKFALPIEPSFAYKLNDLVKNNIFQTKTQRDGNLTVIRTLSYISTNSLSSFEFSPQINIYDNPHSNKPCSELDIICVSEGKLIIGESKHDSSYFKADNNKSLKSLAEVAKIIRPDKIILSCYEDHYNRLANAKISLEHIFNKWIYKPEIVCILLDEPDDFNLTGHRYFYY